MHGTKRCRLPLTSNRLTPPSPLYIASTSPASSSPALDRRGSLWQRACVSLCLETRRPQPYPSVSQVISRLLTCIETLPPSSLSRQSAHRRLRSIVANPRVLAYRAGPQVHWDEARRRVLVSYVQVRRYTRRSIG